jgi:hypothetical protein
MEDLAAVFITPSSWGSQRAGHSTRHQLFSGAIIPAISELRPGTVRASSGQGRRGRAPARDGVVELRQGEARATSGKGRHGRAAARGGVGELRQGVVRASFGEGRPRASSGE